MRTLSPDDLGILEFAGQDAARFLQAQLATDLRKQVPGGSCHAALLAANGRVLAAGTLLLPAEEQFWWLLDRALLEPIAIHLRRYLLRSKLSIKLPDRVRPLLAPPDPTAAQTIWTDAARRCFTLGEADSSDLDPQQYALQAIENGVLDFAAEHSDQHLPQALGLQHSGAIALDKGCYPGQEIVARTHYLGRVKRTLARYRSETTLTSAVLCGSAGNTAGQVLNLLPLSQGCVGLASVQIDTVDARPQTHVGGFELQLLD